jgi:hypothetical protein
MNFAAMIDIISLILLLFTITFTLGGGLYEVLAVYPNWKHDVDPKTLRAKLESSGQLNAGNRFWPLFSPAQGLLSIVNIILAYQYTGEAHNYWLAAAIVIFISRAITFAYFIPVMIRYIMQPEKVEVEKLKAIVKKWTGLSPLRILPEFVAWGLLIAALMQFN